ncbi:hypothetical protein H7171_01400 [Candidatus Saccharibacteria bacterium]|nr:hypothetical protein [Candidatus Saccharibacteria bacterium]
MTRMLSEILRAPEPYFRSTLSRLERMNGNPSADIILSTTMTRVAHSKVSALGLDPCDTTACELYQTIISRVKHDDKILTRTLQTRAATHVSAEADVVAGMVHALAELPIPKKVYALKATAFKALIRKQPPKRAMKELGYRSLESFLKHEQPTAVLAAASLAESKSWVRSLHDRYKKLTPRDFETRDMVVLHLNDVKWQRLASGTVAAKRHNIVSFPELGSMMMLSIPSQAPDGSAIASLTLALHALNDLRASATYLRLCQVRPDFGETVYEVANGRANMRTGLLDQELPWHVVQRYYAHFKGVFNTEVFEPHIQAHDLSWHSVEVALAQIEPSLSFWQGSESASLLHGREAVSLNIVDAAINLCNNLPFEARSMVHMQQALWHELLSKYLRLDLVEQSIMAELRPQLAYQPAMTN